MSNNQKNQSTSEIPIIVVEVFNPDPCHLVIVGREQVDRSWHYFFAAISPDVTFGDHLLLYPKTGVLFLNRGPNLRFHILLEDFPPGLLQDLIFQNPKDDNQEKEEYPK